MQVEFGNNDDSVFVSTLGESGGDLQTSVMRFDINNAESEIWRTYLSSDISFSLERCADGIYAVTSGGAFLLDETTGEITAATVYTRQVTGVTETDGMRAVLFHDAASNGDIAVAYGEGLNITAAITPDSVSAFDVCGGRLYILEGAKLLVFNSMMEGIKTYELDDVYSGVKIINNCAYLLGYNTVQRVEALRGAVWDRNSQ